MIFLYFVIVWFYILIGIGSYMALGIAMPDFTKFQRIILSILWPTTLPPAWINREIE